jgi:hypothetical protein
VKQASWYEWTVGALGLVLIGLLWAPWYVGGVEQATFSVGGGRGAAAGVFLSDVPSPNGWESGTVTSIVVAVVGGLCVAQLVALLIARSPGIGLAWNVGITWLAALLVVWLAARLIWPPEDAPREWGVWTSIIVAAAILLVSWRGMADERTTRRIEPALPVTPIPPAHG